MRSVGKVVSEAQAVGGRVKTSDHLAVGDVYTRADLKNQFQITDATINNGIFQPKGHASVWLFVTKDKTSDRTQYRDTLEGDVLAMEGQTAGRTDHLIVEHGQRGDELVLFYRDSKLQYPGAGFRYEGAFRYEAHAGSGPASFTLRRAQTPGQFKHGDKRTWELALDAITELGGAADPQAVLTWITERYPAYKANNLGADLAMLSVNSPSRTAYGTNVKPRRTDQGSEFDRLFKIGSGPGVMFEVYDPAQHGIWEIYADAGSGNRNGMSVRQVVSPLTQALDDAVQEAEQAGDFDVSAVEDARKRVYGAIVRRRGQPAFRSALIQAYDGTCAVTGCSLLAVLEAAHVHPYKGDHTNVVANGLLLRADIHTLFDLGLIAIDSTSLKVQVSPNLAGTEYASLQGVSLRTPSDACQTISPDALDWHRSRCAW